MKKTFWACIFLVMFLFGCGGGGGNPGTCSGSPVYCAEAGVAGPSGSGTTGGSSTPAGLFTKSGTGNTIFEIPASVTRVRIQGSFTGNSSNFMVQIDGKSVVNVIIGASQNPTTSDGTYLLTGGGKVEITGSSGVSWTFTEVKADNSSIPAGLFAKSGTGDMVFDLPTSVTRIRIQGSFTGNSSNFMVKIAGKTVVNAIIGASQNPTTSDGTYLLTGGGKVEITSSSGVAWTFTQVQ